mgnify:FL=1
MEYRRLGRTELRCSSVGLGTWAFNSSVYGPVDKAVALKAINAAREVDINFFDTAPLYGTGKEDGIAESILGKGLRNCRKEVIVSTKFGRKPTEGNKANFNGRYARQSVEESLQRLATDYIDLLFFHSPFSAREIHDDVWESLERLKKEGKVRFIGHSISKFEDTQGMARAWAEERKIDVIQVVYSLLNREAAKLIDDLGKSGIGIVARESLANGFLSGSVRRDSTFTPGTLNARYNREEIKARVERVAALSFLVRDPVENMAQAALRWVLDNPCVSLVLTGAKNATEVLDGSQAAQWPAFTPEEIDRSARLHLSDFPAA